MECSPRARRLVDIECTSNPLPLPLAKTERQLSWLMHAPALLLRRRVFMMSRYVTRPVFFAPFYCAICSPSSRHYFGFRGGRQAPLGGLGKLSFKVRYWFVGEKRRYPLHFGLTCVLLVLSTPNVGWADIDEHRVVALIVTTRVGYDTN